MKGLGLRKLANNVLKTLARQIGAGLLQLVTLVLIARIYGPEGNGVYTVALIFPAMLASFLNLGISPANVYYLGAGKVSPSVAWRSSFLIFSAITVLGLFVGSFMIIVFSEQWFPGVSFPSLWVALLVFPVALLQSIISSFFQGLQNFRKFNSILLLQPFLTLLGIALLMFLGFHEITLLLCAYLLASIVTLIIARFLLQPYLSITNYPDFNRYSLTMLNYGYKAHLSNILAFVNYKSDIFLVNMFLGPAGAGIYTIAAQISERLWLLSQAVSTVLLPRLSQLSSDESKRKQLTPLLTRWVLWITCLGGIFLATVAYPLIVWVFGEEFSSAYWALVLLLPGMIAGSASRILANDIAARGRPELNMYTSFIVVVLNIVGNLLLIPLFGLLGAAIATSLAYFINFLMRLITHRYLTEVSILSNILIRRDDIMLIRSLMSSE
ncbi:MULTISPECIES: oligosaccharide flippase family protein [Marinobacter]|uniref:oligosaccharide flippase family protein n=4 Tax=Marinobacteraceae TaxID=2887365 RepID=UPI00294251D1|nr:oligosaccharide flippase family protein [Marinobacter salarius]WOI21262.1 oligosaccharide flippase family protein [Marinobacter salarius]